MRSCREGPRPESRTVHFKPFVIAEGFFLMHIQRDEYFNPTLSQDISFDLNTRRLGEIIVYKKLLS